AAVDRARTLVMEFGMGHRRAVDLGLEHRQLHWVGLRRLCCVFATWMPIIPADPWCSATIRASPVHQSFMKSLPIQLLDTGIRIKKNPRRAVGRGFQSE